MPFYKIADSNIPSANIQEVVQVIHDKHCEKCDTELNIGKSKNGIIKCQKCGWDNSITENNNG